MANSYVYMANSSKEIFLISSAKCHSSEIEGVSLITVKIIKAIKGDVDKAKQRAHVSNECWNYKMGPQAFIYRKDFTMPCKDSPVCTAVQ